MGSPMKLPQTPETLVLRTHFGDDAAWETVCDEIRRSSCEGYVHTYSFVSDPAWSDFPSDRFTSFPVPPYYFFVVDRTTLEHPEHPVLAVNLDKNDEEPYTFRMIPSNAAALAANLEIANMDFVEYAENADSDGIFRGFPAV